MKGKIITSVISVLSLLYPTTLLFAENGWITGSYKGFMYPTESTCSLIDPSFYIDTSIRLKTKGRKVTAVFKENRLTSPENLKFKGKISRDGDSFSATQISTLKNPMPADTEPLILSGRDSNEKKKALFELKFSGSEFIHAGEPEVPCHIIYSGLLSREGTPNSPSAIYRLGSVLENSLRVTTNRVERYCKQWKAKKKSSSAKNRLRQAEVELRDLRTDAATLPGRIDRKIFLLEKNLKTSSNKHRIRERIAKLENLKVALNSRIARARKAEKDC